MQPVRSWVLNLAVAAVALLMSTIAGEVILRAVVDLPLRRVLPEVRYATHPVRRFTVQPDQQVFTYGAPVRIDERGFRSTGSPRADARLRILALGDSFTFGLGVPDGETWPGRLSARLARSRGVGVEVINAGTISYGVFQELDLLRERGLSLSPHIVIHGLYWNDFMNAGPPEPGAAPVVDANGYLTWDGLEPRAGLRGFASAATSSSALLFSAKKAIASLTAPRQSTGYGSAYERFLSRGLSDDEWLVIENFYRDLHALSRAHGFRVMVAIMPVVDIVTSDRPEDHPYRVEARRRLERVGVEYVDGFMGQTAASFLAQGRDAHCNALGYRIISEHVAKQLSTSDWLTNLKH